MVKFAKGDEKPFDPISNKLLNAIANPPQQGESVEDAPRLELAEQGHPPAPLKPDAQVPESKSPPAKKSPERSKRRQPKAPTLSVLTKQSKKPERLNCVVKCLFTPTEDQELRAMVGRLAQDSGIKLTFSHLIRPYFDLLLYCEEQLAEELRGAGLTRPVNDKTALAYFESRLAEVIHNAMRKTPLLRSERSDTDE
jgi:hypothetical protein